jgi:hypothetical protein
MSTQSAPYAPATPQTLQPDRQSKVATQSPTKLLEGSGDATGRGARFIAQVGPSPDACVATNPSALESALVLVGASWSHVPPVILVDTELRMNWRPGAGWTCTVCCSRGEIELEQLDGDGSEWLASGPGGESVGALSEVIRSSASMDADQGWSEAVVAAITRELATGTRRSNLLVRRGTGEWYHVSWAENRTSIRTHGLDWRRMAGHGIAGSAQAEWPGIYLCSSLEDARFFATMGTRRGRPVDVWAVRLDGQWLEGAPESDGGGGDNWMICPEPISPKRIRLVEHDLSHQ